jgi:hypothetical protein
LAVLNPPHVLAHLPYPLVLGVAIYRKHRDSSVLAEDNPYPLSRIDPGGVFSVNSRKVFPLVRRRGLLPVPWTASGSTPIVALAHPLSEGLFRGLRADRNWLPSDCKLFFDASGHRRRKRRCLFKGCEQRFGRHPLRGARGSSSRNISCCCDFASGEPLPPRPVF